VDEPHHLQSVKKLFITIAILSAVALSVFGALSDTTAFKGWMAQSHVASGGSSFIQATGGTITTNGNIRIHTFNGDGTFQVISGSGVVSNLVLAGGGGGSSGGSGESGGGGAGGMISSNQTLTVGSYSVTVGPGGAGDFGGDGGGLDGGDSVFNGITAKGGGHGGGYVAKNGANGGSGGGAAADGGSAGSGTAGQGNNGASIGGSGAGGGGAGAVGGNPTGGAGLASPVPGDSSTYATGGTGNNASSAAGAANTGNGGDGSQAFNIGKNGGSGKVVVWYQFQ
jgi:hypothetical protein